MNQTDIKVFCVINSGSSSLKFSLFSGPELNLIIKGVISALHTEQAELVVTEAGGDETTQPIGHADHSTAIKVLLEQLRLHGVDRQQIAAVGHRVVHGGEFFNQSVVIDDKVIDRIRQCGELAPLHNSANLLGIEAMIKTLAKITQVAVFDTAFHQTLPRHAFLYALPDTLYQDLSIRRYGFHGTSLRWVSPLAVSRLKLRHDDHQLIVAHLGNGCSATAIVNGESRDTTMGLTPLDGLMMGTRSGDVDPGLHQYLNHKLGWDIDKITDLLNKKSGLLGASQWSSDMQELTDAALAGHQGASLAIELFCFRVAKAIGALTTSLQRIDAVVFTGGIGENSALVRSKTIDHLKIFNLYLDPQRNNVNGKYSDGEIHQQNCPPILVIATDEEKVIARDTLRLYQENNH